jgi:hypothetical protein
MAVNVEALAAAFSSQLQTAFSTALGPLQTSLQVLVAQGEARDQREAARDQRETARDQRETARDQRETARDLRETARFEALLGQGSAHTAALDRVSGVLLSVSRSISTLQLRSEGSPQHSPFAQVSRAEVGERVLAFLSASGADVSFLPTAGPAALTPALLDSLSGATKEGELVALVLPQLRELLGCGAAGAAAAAAAHDACARELIDGQGHAWLDSLTEPLPSSRREKPDLFLVPAPLWHRKPSPGGAATGMLASRALQLDGCVREVLEAKRGTGSLSGEDLGQLASYLEMLPGACRGALFNARHLWLYEALDGVPVRLVRSSLGAGGSAALLRDFFPPRRAEAALVTTLRDVMAQLRIAPSAPGAAFLGAGGTGRVFCVRRAAAGGGGSAPPTPAAAAAAAALAAAPQQRLALKVSSRAPQGGLEMEFAILAAAAAQGAPVAAPVPGTLCTIFSRATGQFLGAGYLMHEVLQALAPVNSLKRCKKVFEALAALHGKGFCHGDARLPNLLQRSSGELVWIDMRALLTSAVALAADREALAASVLGWQRGSAARGQVAAALEAAALAAQGGAAEGYGEIAAAVFGALAPV